LHTHRFLLESDPAPVVEFFTRIGITAASGVPRNFVPGGVQQIQLRTEDRQNGDLGAVDP